MLLIVHLDIKRHNFEGKPRLQIGTLGVLVDREGGRGNEYDGGETQNAFHPKNDFGRRGTRNGTNSDI